MNKVFACIAAFVMVMAGFTTASSATIVTGPFHVDIWKCDGAGNAHGDFLSWGGAMHNSFIWISRGHDSDVYHIARVRLSYGNDNTLWASWNWNRCGNDASGGGNLPDGESDHNVANTTIELDHCNGNVDVHYYRFAPNASMAGYEIFINGLNNDAQDIFMNMHNYGIEGGDSSTYWAYSGSSCSP